MKNWNYALSSAAEAPLDSVILLKGSICENLKKAADLGYQGIEVHMRPDDEVDVEAVLEAEKTYGTKVAMIITGRLNTEAGCSLIDDRPYVEAAAVKGMMDYIDLAQKLHAGLVIGWVRGSIPAGGKREKYMNRLARNLKQITACASEKGVPVNVEVINRYETNIFTTAEETMRFIEQYQIENLYVHLDTFHMGIEECDAIEAIKRCKGKIGYFHLADNTRRRPGSGTFDFANILKALEEVAYDGYLSVECLPWPSTDEMEAAKEALAYMKQVEAQ